MLLGWKGEKREASSRKVFGSYQYLLFVGVVAIVDIKPGQGPVTVKQNTLKSVKTVGISYTYLPTWRTDLLASHICTDKIRKVNFDSSDKPLCVTI